MAVKAPYSLVVKFRDGRVETIASGHDPVATRRNESRVSRNSELIARIELHDLSGALETIWAASWDSLPD